jgi:DNA processing protein
MLTLTGAQIPDDLTRLPQPVTKLYVEGNWAELLKRPKVAIVGSRKLSTYGRQVTECLSRDLSRQGVVIVSGLALGVDSVAHRAALAVKGATIAVLPSPLEKIYPASHHNLARQIVDQGGALITEYANGAELFKTNFLARNRIIAGLADATLITEAALISGSLHTARYALEQGKDVLAVPGNITSPTSVGTNNLIKSGAVPVTNYEDVLQVLGLEVQGIETPPPKGDTPAEQLILDLLATGEQEGALLQAKTELPIDIFSQTITMLEIKGMIRAVGADRWSL